MRATTRRRAQSDDSGASAVEFALLFPLFAMLCFGTISAGFAFARQINITQSAREASRYGSTLSLKASAPNSTGTIDTWLAAVFSAATTTAGNGAFAGYSSVCVSYTSGGSSTHYDGAKSNGACPGTSTPGGMTSYVQVIVTRDTNFNYILGSSTLTLSSTSTTPFEATTS